MPHAKYRHRETYHGIKIDVSAPTQRELKSKITQKKDEIDGILPGAYSMTVSQWLYVWLETYKRQYISESYYKSIQSRIENYALPHIGAMPIADVREIHIQKILNACKGKSKSHLHKLRINLSEMFAKAASNGYIDRNPCTEVRQPDGDAGSHRALTDTEMLYFHRACAESGFTGLWGLFLLGTGIRPQESVPLKWRDIDASKRRVKISSALKADGVIGKTKTPAGVREVPIPTPIYDALNAYRRDDDDIVFSRDGGKTLSKEAIRHRWNVLYDSMRELAKLDGVEESIGDDLTLYCLRHTYCTDLLRSGVPMETAKVLMGHSSIAMVDRVYGHHTEDQTERAESLINAFYEANRKNICPDILP